jgi:chaperonin cofactor prefoldin
MLRSLSKTVIVLLFAGLPAGAQAPVPSSSQSSSPSQDSITPADTSKPKKVWTNDDVKSAGAVSVIGDPKNKAKASPAKNVSDSYVASVRKQLEKLQKQIADIDKQLMDLKNFSEGDPSNNASGIKLNKSYNREPIEVQMRELQHQKKDLRAQVDALLDEARKKGVEPGQLR